MFHYVNSALSVVLRENTIMYQHYRMQDGKLSGLFNVAGVCNVCVSKLVFSFNYGAAFPLISWYMRALLYFEVFSDHNSYVQ